jgi:hypothetical protein
MTEIKLVQQGFVYICEAKDPAAPLLLNPLKLLATAL